MPPLVEHSTCRRRCRRVGAPRPLLVAAASLLLVLLLTPYAAVSATTVDVPAELYLLGAQSPPDAPQELNAVLERQLNGTALSDLSAALQRALLWDAGWLRLSDSSGGSSGSTSSSASSTAAAAAAAYVQVLVPCGKGMDDVFVASEALETRCAVESECAQPSGGNSSAWSCSSRRDMAEMAQCAVQLQNGSLSGSTTAEMAMENASWPAVALASSIDASFDPQVFRYVNATEEEDADAVFLIAARGSWRADSANFCFQAPLFVTPCRLLTASSNSSSSDSGSAAGWCEPERLRGVNDWLSIELAALASNEQHVGGESSPSSSFSGDNEDTVLLIGMVAAVVVLIMVISVPFFIARRNQCASRQPPTTTSRHQRRHQRRPRSRSERASDFRLLTDR